MERVDIEECLAAARDGDQSALQQLLLANFDRLAEHIRIRIPDSIRPEVDVDDILQMTFVEVFRGFSKFHSGDADAFYAWLRAVANARRSRCDSECKTEEERRRLETARLSCPRLTRVLYAPD